MTEPIALDPEALARLREWGGEALMAKMLELFLANTPERMDQIRRGIDRGDAKLVERGAHSLKSTAANLGAGRLRELAAELEDRAVAGESATLEGRLPELEQAYDLARKAVESLKDGESAAS